MKQKISAVKTEEGDGAMVLRLFPTVNLNYLDPFVLLDEFFVKKGTGFPDHQHRGFEAVTYMLDGSFKHKDNIGNEKEIFAGGAMRFTAGAGLIHSEMPGKAKFNHGLQLWINLPRKLKKSKPSFQSVDYFEDYQVGESKIKHIVGGGSKIKLNTSVIYQDIAIKKGNRFKISFKKKMQGFIYLLKGELNELNPGEALFTDKDVEIVSKNDSRFVFVAGTPHNEPIIQNGPYVD